MPFQSQNKQQLPLKTRFQLGQELSDMKKKTISGLVTGIIDGNTFEISVSNEPNGNSLGDKHTETIRILGMNKPAATTLPGILAKLELEKMIVGRTVECEIVSRDESNQAIANVPKKYFRSPFSFDPDSAE
jgi:endonuclease YncB( thermonuclease family)